MPNLKILRNIVDRLKKLDHYVVVSAKGTGHLTFEISTHKATVATHFKDLSVEKSPGMCKSFIIIIFF